MPELRYAQNIYEEILVKHCKTGIAWIDLGCGHNLLSPWRAEKEKELMERPGLFVGFDYDLLSLQKNNTAANKVRGDMNRLPFASNTFDLITSNMVFEHLQEPDIAFKEIYRILKPGGILIFHTPNSIGYTTVSARLLPEAIKGKLVEFLQDREEEDIFPTYFKVNSPDAINMVAGHTGFQVDVLKLLVSKPQFIYVPPVVILELLYLRLLMTKPFKKLRTNIIAILEK
ncbi:MAG: class I SAM-dependent methyltransferase [Nitrospira sp.]|nr:class I SAM-dependent methyltransferase [Nitrospira sp.]